MNSVDENLEKLTQQELDILALICNGDSSDSIIKKLFIAKQTLHSRLTSVYKKLGISENPDFSQRVKAALIYREAYPYQFVRNHLDSERLTPSEFGVLRLISQGYSNPRIARELNIKHAGVGKMIETVYSKLGIVYEGSDSRVLAMLMFDVIKELVDGRNGTPYKNRV